MTHQEVHSTKANEVGDFVNNLIQAVASDSGNTFDSANATGFASDFNSGRVLANAPDSVKVLFDENKDSATALSKAMFDSVAIYRKEHGTNPANDVLHQAIHSAFATTKHAMAQYALDSASASSLHHDQMGIQTARAIVSIISTLGDAIPFAHYLPADISNNEAKLAIVSNKAASNFGSYTAESSLDGVNSGDAYITSSRVHRLAVNVDGINFTGALTKKQGSGNDYDLCDPAGGEIKLLRGRSLVHVNGRVVAREIDSKGVGQSSISGQFNNGTTVHSVSGNINTDTGVIAVKIEPAIPGTFEVLVEGFIDYERAPELTPSIITMVDTFTLHAKPWRVTTTQTIDSRTQMSNELGLDPYSQQVVTVNSQFANERHYDVLRKAARLAVSNQTNFTFNMNPADWKNAQIGLSHAIGVVSQQMAVDTLGFGVSHIYVGKTLAALFMALPSDMFVPSGIPARAGTYRIGRLYNQYDIYYTPKVVGENRMLCIGRAPDVARNPFVLGDAVPPTVVPLSVGQDLKSGAGFYARNFTAINPYEASSKACAWINVSLVASV